MSWAEAQTRTLVDQVGVLVRSHEQLGADARRWELAWRYQERAHRYFAPLLLRLRVHSPSVVVDEYEAALSAQAVRELLHTDLILQGQPRTAPECGEVWLVVEVSASIGRHDIERAVRRARALGEAGLPVLPVVTGEKVADKALQDAAQEHAVVILGLVITGWEAALDAWAPPPGPPSSEGR